VYNLLATAATLFSLKLLNYFECTIPRLLYRNRSKIEIDQSNVYLLFLQNVIRYCDNFFSFVMSSNLVISEKYMNTLVRI
jgi:hypothetical protein